MDRKLPRQVMLHPKVCSKIKTYFDKEETGMQRYTEKFVNDMSIGIPQWNEPLS